MPGLLKTLRRFWTRSIQRQLVLGIVLVHAVLMTIFVFDLVARQQNFLHQQSIAQTESLTETLATNSSSWLLANDVVGLEEIVRALSRYPQLRYAMILSPDGRVLAHSDNDYVGKYISDAISLSILQATPKTHTLLDTPSLIDMVTPIMANQKSIGWARVALGQEDIDQGLDVITRNGVIYTFIAIAIGALFALFMAKGLTRGLQHIVHVSSEIRQGRRHARSELDRQDELGQLSKNFDDMLEALAENEFKTWLAQEQLMESEERFNLAMRGANDGLFDWDIVSGQVYYSPRWQEMLGYASDEIEPDINAWRGRIHPDDAAKAESHLTKFLAGSQELFDDTHRLRHQDGSYHWHRVRGILVKDKQGNNKRMVGTSRDITEYKQLSEALYDEKERAEVTLHSIGDAVITTDEHGHIMYMNPVAEALIGWNKREVIGKPLQDVFLIHNEESREPVENPVHICLRQGVVVGLANHTVLTNRHGVEVAIEDSAAPIRDRQGKIIGVVMVFHDVGLTRELTRKMTWQATHDSLTGLINRNEFEHHLSHLIQSAQTEGRVHALLYLDLDQFKLVNDTCGHAAGDALLKQLSFLLLQKIAAPDILARLGGDEFGVLLHDRDMQAAHETAEALRQVVNEFRFSWDKNLFEIGVSIGLTLIERGMENINDILGHADVACYAAKDLGRNRIHAYEPNDMDMARRRSEMQWASEITRALEENRFVLYQQRIIPVDHRHKSESIEILVRMLDSDGQIVPPFTFIPAAERYNLMPAIDRWVIDNTLLHLSQHRHDFHHVAINLSGTSLADDSLLGFIKARLEYHKIPPRLICFEITETAAISNLAKAVDFIEALKAEGCSFALDDFGSGLSSFTYLKTMPVDYLKIDGSFVKDLETDPIDRAMVSAINAIGHVMEIRTIAEFVENDRILAILSAIGVDYAQGYGIAKPAPLKAPD
ncbi:MAG: EAL domain-containing protein [Gammaproteobacteria bacterium]